MYNIKIKYDINIGDIFGDMEIIEYRGRTKNAGNKKYLVKCIVCGYTKEMKDSHIKAHVGTTHGRGCDKDITKIKIGELYNDMKIIKYIGKAGKSNNKKYLVECIVCGEEKEMKDSHIRDHIGTKHGRGCNHIKRKNDPLTIGNIVDDMKIIEHEVDRRRFKVKCTICGKEKYIHDSNLYNHRGSNHSTSCNRIEKLSSEHPALRNIYSSIIQRTTNPNNMVFIHYGGRGIKNKFKNFKHFIDTMADSYYEHVKQYGRNNTSIDRIDNDGDYSPENCRWATYKEQRANQRLLNTQKYFKATSPNGEVFISYSQQEFGRNNDLSPSSIGKCLHGKLPSHKGWKFEYI